MAQRSSELTVITRAKELCSYVMTITQKSPKQFRFTFVSRMQNYTLDVVEKLFRANDTFVTRGNMSQYQIRYNFQQEAMTCLKLLCYVSQIAMEQRCILMKQFEEISRLSYECMNLLGAWMNSDRRRLMP